MPPPIITGTPGAIWKNDTGEIYYQYNCEWHNTCGACAQNDGAVKRGSWPIPMHRGCRCRQTPLLPGQSAPRPFVDFVKEIEGLDPAQQKEVVGVSNWKLIESGKVKWEDVVSPSRVRDLSEVVATRGLSVDDLVAAGVRPSVAEKAWDRVHTADIVAIEAERKVLIARLTAAGLDLGDIATLGASVIGKMEGMVVGPGGGIDVDLLEALLARVPRLAAVPPIVFGPSPAKVASVGPDVPPDLDLASLVGAPADATVTALQTSSGATYIRATGDGYEVRVEVKGTSMKFTSMEVDPSMQGKGLGTQVFGTMVEAAQKAGVTSITMVGSADGGDVGYLVWPKMGFDGPIPAAVLATLPPDLAGAKNVSDLYATPQGQAWWALNGATIPLTFDPTPGSYSMQVWDGYLGEKGTAAGP